MLCRKDLCEVVNGAKGVDLLMRSMVSWAHRMLWEGSNEVQTPIKSNNDLAQMSSQCEDGWKYVSIKFESKIEIFLIWLDFLIRRGFQVWIVS